MKALIFLLLLAGPVMAEDAAIRIYTDTFVGLNDQTVFPDDRLRLISRRGNGGHHYDMKLPLSAGAYRAVRAYLESHPITIPVSRLDIPCQDYGEEFIEFGTIRYAATCPNNDLIELQQALGKIIATYR